MIEVSKEYLKITELIDKLEAEKLNATTSYEFETLSRIIRYLDDILKDCK